MTKWKKRSLKWVGGAMALAGVGLSATMQIPSPFVPATVVALLIVLGSTAWAVGVSGRVSS